MNLYFSSKRKAELFRSTVEQYMPEVIFNVGCDKRGWHVSYTATFEYGTTVNLVYHMWIEGYATGKFSERNSLD